MSAWLKAKIDPRFKDRLEAEKDGALRRQYDDASNTVGYLPSYEQLREEAKTVVRATDSSFRDAMEALIAEYVRVHNASKELYEGSVHNNDDKEYADIWRFAIDEYNKKTLVSVGDIDRFLTTLIQRLVDERRLPSGEEILRRQQQEVWAERRQKEAVARFEAAARQARKNTGQSGGAFALSTASLGAIVLFMAVLGSVVPA